VIQRHSSTYGLSYSFTSWRQRNKRLQNNESEPSYHVLVPKGYISRP